jgi:RNA polymerase sigma-70 factor (ECF subfamily)
MSEHLDNRFEGADLRHGNAGMSAAEVDRWFAREILPLEQALMQFLQHNWRNRGDVTDLRQDIYVQVYQAALTNLPERPKQFLFATARNLLINRVRHAQVVPIDPVPDLEALSVADNEPGPDRALIAREELRRLQTAIDHLPPRCREVVVLARIEGYSGREITRRLGISEATVSEHLKKGMRILADILYGNPPNREEMP